MEWVKNEMCNERLQRFRPFTSSRQKNISIWNLGSRGIKWIVIGVMILEMVRCKKIVKNWPFVYVYIGFLEKVKHINIKKYDCEI